MELRDLAGAPGNDISQIFLVNVLGHADWHSDVDGQPDKPDETRRRQ
ncbi:UNVERIFIED_ORG: hypothetical protein ABIC62_005958 [Burkholderia sp. 1595]|jgi:hypothetical protein|uniref:Uncharacterized protein n=1 Tax=Paraburkholderia terricola TaxID=169427 RepID=A0ABU1M1L5_9BURK|nr:hypothetical protein [Paraburkholderia terricola]MDR6450210.1 hypothetical protein [Paraburkholderia terricola]MDR6485045.1 hypothetical protein [Paraburkholderia terricola]